MAVVTDIHRFRVGLFPVFLISAMALKRSPSRKTVILVLETDN